MRPLHHVERTTCAARRREWTLARLCSVLPSLFHFVRGQLAYREALADLAPGALAAEEVIDQVVLRAYMASTTAEHADIAATVRQLAIEQIAARVSKGTPEDRRRILYFFEPNGDGVTTSSEPATGPDGHAEHDVVRRAFENTLAGMPAVWRQVMLLHHVDGLVASAVARVVGRSESDVRRMVDHACAYLREQLFEARDRPSH